MRGWILRNPKDGRGIRESIIETYDFLPLIRDLERLANVERRFPLSEVLSLEDIPVSLEIGTS